MDDFKEKGLKFECNGCSECCRFKGGLVLLSEHDLERLAEWAGLTNEQFTKAYCQNVGCEDGKTYLCLRTLHKNPETDDCIFWDGSIPGCGAYEVRPDQCRTYPFWTKILESEEKWNAEKRHCPGINCGKLHEAEEVKSELSKYEQRIPITR